MALVLAGLLVISGAEAVVWPQIVSAAGSKAVSPQSVPLLPSATPVPAPSAPAHPSGDFRTLATGAGDSGTHFTAQRSKVVSQSTFQTVYLNPDGTHSIRQSSAPVNVQDQAGAWHAVDPTLRVDAASKRASATHQPLAPVLAGTASDPALLSLSTGGVSASLALPSAAAHAGAVHGAGVSYADVLPDTDLSYQVTAGSVKETILLKKPAAAGDGSWRFALNTGGLTPVMDKAGEVLLLDASNAVRMAIPPVETWDSAGDVRKNVPPAVTGGSYRVDHSGEGWTLTVSVNAGWLKDPRRVFPVHVDPTITLGMGQSYDYRSDGYSCSNCGLRIGNSQYNGDSYNRAFVTFPWAQIFDKSVVGAELDVTRDTSVVGSVLTWPATLWWASGLDYYHIGTQVASAPIGGCRQFHLAVVDGDVAEHRDQPQLLTVFRDGR